MRRWLIKFSLPRTQTGILYTSADFTDKALKLSCRCAGYNFEIHNGLCSTVHRRHLAASTRSQCVPAALSQRDPAQSEASVTNSAPLSTVNGVSVQRNNITDPKSQNHENPAASQSPTVSSPREAAVRVILAEAAALKVRAFSLAAVTGPMPLSSIFSTKSTS